MAMFTTAPGRTDEMRTETATLNPRGELLAAVKWLRRAVPTGLVLLIVALFVQPPAQQAPAAPTKADPTLYRQALANPSERFPVIVREADPSTSGAEDLVRSLGGRVTHELGIVGGFSAQVPGSAVAPLTASGLVWRVWGDGRIHMAGVNMGQFDSWAPNTLWKAATRVQDATSRYNGAGVGVALIDTGVVPVPDLVNHVVERVDFTPEADGYDRFGHGTHMAGIIVGDGTSSSGQYTGVAPGANLISVKVAGASGATDVSVIIAALQWVVSHRAQYNIRVLNLSFGTDSKQPYSVDPLDYAVEQAWFSGILVVVSAGNTGPTSGTVTKPGDDPYVVTVGAADQNNSVQKSDDTITSFSARGPTQDGFAKPDIVGPGVTIVSDRDTGSTVDVNHPAAVVGTSYFKGTGTSQAAAVVSGVAALMFEANPSLTNNQAKAILKGTAKAYNDLTGDTGAGAGLVDAYGATNAAASNAYANSPANQNLTPSTGLGSLEASRGTMHVYADTNGDGVPELVTGEINVLGNSWSANSWSANTWSANSWSGNSWSTYAFEGNSWSTNSWSGNSWSGMQWDANSWSANSWSGNSWSGNSWSANSWSGNSWSANSWSANSWSASSWTGNTWS